MKNGTATMVLLAGLALSIFLLVVFDMIGPLGWQIPQPDLTGDYFMGVMWATLLGLSIYMWPVSSSDKKSLTTAWVARCVVTLVMMLAYENSNGIDSFWYFEESTRSLPGVWSAFKLGEGTTNMMVLCRYHAQIFPDSFHMMKVSFSMVGFVATYLLYRASVFLLEREDIRVFFVLALFPSMIFWSSTIGKDPITLLGIALYVYGVSAWYRTFRTRYLVIMLIGVWVALSMRIWLGPILLVPLAVFLLARMRNLLYKFLLIGVVAAAFLYSGRKFQEIFRIESSQDLVSTIEGRAHSTGWAGNTALSSGRSFTSVGDLILFMPLGAFAALFRPLPGEIMSVFGIFAGMENLVLIVLLLQAIKRTRLLELKDPRVLWALTLILTWSSIYGFISYQNLGAAVRFRLQILPVLLCTLLYLRRDRRLDLDHVRE